MSENSDRPPVRTAERAKAKEHLIVQTAFLGDLLLGVPFFKAFRSLYPKDKITLLCRTGLGSPLVMAGLIDELVEVDKSSKTSWSKVSTLLRARNFELVVSPHESFRSALLIARLNARKKIGYPRFFNSFIFNERVPRPMELPEALRQLALLIPIDPTWESRLDDFRKNQNRSGGQMANHELTHVPEWADMSVARFAEIGRGFRANLETDQAANKISPGVQVLINELDLSPRDAIAVLAPGSVWPTKKWTSDGYLQVATDLMRDGYRILWMGGAGEREICESLALKLPGSANVAARTSLTESIELLSIADVLICNDSGAMHMGSLAGVKTVSIFGPTVLDFGYRPWQNRAVVVQADLACRPCGKHGAKKCPLGTHDCMKLVSANDVMNGVQSFRSDHNLMP